jgi:hypothetical protein
MASYEAIVVSQQGSVVEGDVRKKAKVSLLRYATPTAKPVKAGSRIIRAWTVSGLERSATEAAKQLMAIDQGKRRDEILSTIDRMEASSQKKR